MTKRRSFPTTFFPRRARRLIGALLALPIVAAAMPAGVSFGATTVERLQIPFPQDDGSLTPYTFELGYSLMTLVYDTLMWHDPDGIPQPWLARSITASPDGRAITVVLPPGVKWQDNVALTSADIAFTFRFIAAHPHPRFTPELVAVLAVETPDPLTAVIKLKTPSPGFLDQPLSDMPILPEHLWKDLPPGRVAPDGLPLGSGPYRLVRYLEKESYRFQANNEYFRGPPAVKFLEVPFINDAGKTFSSFETGKSDMIPVSLPAASVDRLQSIGTGIARGPSYLGTVLMFNLRQPPFDKLEVRQAAARSLDLSRIAQQVGLATPAKRGYLHPSSRFAPSEDLPAGGGSGGSPALDGQSVEVLAPDNDPIKIEAGRQVVLALKRAGASVVLRRLPRDELSRTVGEDGSPPQFQAAIWSSSPLASYEPDFLRRVFGSNPTDATFNYAGYQNPDFDSLADQISTTADPKLRQDAVTGALRLIATDTPVVPLFFSQGAFAFRQSRYKGWVFVKGSGILDKRSFEAPAAPDPSATASAPASLGPIGAESPDPTGPTSSGTSPFGLIGLGFVAAAVILGAVGFLRGRR
ncbi:MAG: ABC transporter substrate-binding protein [Actinomycetota bacterium]